MSPSAALMELEQELTEPGTGSFFGSFSRPSQRPPTHSELLEGDDFPGETSRFGGWLVELPRGSQAALRLKSPLRYDLSRDPDDNSITLFIPFLGCAGTGRTYEEALADLADTLSYLASDLITEPDDRLAIDALELKRKLAELIR